MNDPLFRPVTSLGAVLLFAIVLVGASGSPCLAQVGAAADSRDQLLAHDLPRFEVATIKEIDPKGAILVGLQVYPGGRVIINGASLKTLVGIAFHKDFWQLTGGDDRTRSVRYNIEAKPPEDLQPAITNLRYSYYEIDDERLRGMLQALLIDRFHLRFHLETKTGLVYLLERNGKKLPLQPAKVLSDPERGTVDTHSEISFVDGHWFLLNVTMAELAVHASTYFFHCPVLDKTSTPGAFSYQSPVRLDQDRNATPDQYAAAMNEAFNILLSEIGLKVERSKGAVESLVIDHADGPSEN